jgi:hypothetical protein
MTPAPAYLPHVWLLLHFVLAAIPPTVYWAYRRRWRITLFGCFLVLSASGIAASWLAMIVRDDSAYAYWMFLLDTRTLLTATIVFVASLLITVVVHARHCAKASAG